MTTVAPGRLLKSAPIVVETVGRPVAISALVRLLARMRARPELQLVAPPDEQPRRLLHPIEP